jgi:O-antigen ligase
VLGAIAGAGALGWAYLGPRYFKHAWIGVALCLTACVASFTRTAWIAVVIVLALTLITPLRKRIELRILLVGALGTTVLSAWILASDGLGNYTPKSGGITSSVGNQTDILGRLYQFAPAFRDLLHRPILGGGIDSYGQRHILAGVHEHLGNLELMVLNDTGVLGLVVFIAFGVAVAAAAWRFRENPLVVGLAAMVTLIALTNQATETLELMVTWLMVGLLLAAADVAARVSVPPIAHSARYSAS